MTSVTFTVRDSDPFAPVIVRVYVPRGALDRVVIVSVDVDVAGFGLNDAVVRDGAPLRLSETEPENPFSLFTVTAYVVLPPRVTVRDVGVAESAKSGARPCTTSVTDVVCVRTPLTPVIVNEEVPAGVADVLDTVIVDVPVVGFGLNAAAAPAGSPLALSVTGPLKPEIGVADTVYDVDAP